MVVTVNFEIYCAGFKSGARSIPSEAAGRSWPGDIRKPFGYKGPDSQGSQVHDSQSPVRRTGISEIQDFKQKHGMGTIFRFMI